MRIDEKRYFIPSDDRKEGSVGKTNKRRYRKLESVQSEDSKSTTENAKQDIIRYYEKAFLDHQKYPEQGIKELNELTDELTIIYSPFIQAIAKKLGGLGLDVDNAVGNGYLGFLEGLRNFPNRKEKSEDSEITQVFQAYIAKAIKSAIFTGLGDSNQISIDPYIKSQMLKAKRLMRERNLDIESEKEIRELLQFKLHLKEETINRVLLGLERENASQMYLSELIPKRSGNIIVSDTLIAPEENTTSFVLSQEQTELLEEVKKSLPNLLPLQRKVLEMKYGLRDGIERSEEEIAEEFGLSRDALKRILSRSIRILRGDDRRNFNLDHFLQKNHISKQMIIDRLGILNEVEKEFVTHLLGINTDKKNLKQISELFSKKRSDSYRMLRRISRKIRISLTKPMLNEEQTVRDSFLNKHNLKLDQVISSLHVLNPVEIRLIRALLGINSKNEIVGDGLKDLTIQIQQSNLYSNQVESILNSITRKVKRETHRPKELSSHQWNMVNNLFGALNSSEKITIAKIIATNFIDKPLSSREIAKLAFSGDKDKVEVVRKYIMITLATTPTGLVDFQAKIHNKAAKFQLTQEAALFFPRAIDITSLVLEFAKETYGEFSLARNNAERNSNIQLLSLVYKTKAIDLIERFQGKIPKSVEYLINQNILIHNESLNALEFTKKGLGIYLSFIKPLENIVLQKDITVDKNTLNSLRLLNEHKNSTEEHIVATINQLKGYIYIAKNLSSKEKLSKSSLIKRLESLHIPNPEVICNLLDFSNTDLLVLENKVSTPIRFAQLRHFLTQTNLSYPKIASNLGIHPQSVNDKVSELFHLDNEFKNYVYLLRERRSLEEHQKRKQLVRNFAFELTQKEIANKLGLDRKIVFELLEEIKAEDKLFEEKMKEIKKQRKITGINKLPFMELSYKRKEIVRQLLQENKSVHEISESLHISLSQTHVIIRNLGETDPELAKKIKETRFSVHRNKITERRNLQAEKIKALLKQGDTPKDMSQKLFLTEDRIKRIIKDMRIE